MKGHSWLLGSCAPVQGSGHALRRVERIVRRRRFGTDVNTGPSDVTAIVHQNAVVGAVKNAFLEQQHRIVEIVDLPLLNPEQLVTLGSGVHQHLLGLHKVLEHKWIWWRWGRVRSMRR